MTDSDYQAWLSELGAERVLLAEMEYEGGTEYLASAPYVTRPTDADPNRVYDDLLAEAIDIETRIDGLIRFGEISLIDDGEIASWVNRAWQGHPIRLYLGDPAWSRDDFRLHARGINGGITEARRGVLVFEMRDQSATLDEPIDTGSLPDDGGPVPLLLGQCYNVPAVRVDTQTLTYRVSYLPLTSVTPKDSGNPVPHTDDLANGQFVLDNATQAQLTADAVQADTTPAAIVGWVAAQYGLTVASTSLPAYVVGLYYSGEVTGRQILDDLTRGLGAYWYLDELGELVVRQHVAPSGPADITLTSDDIADDGIALVETQAPWSELTLRFARNYQPLSQVAGVVEDTDPIEAEKLKREWRESEASQALTGYPLAETAERDSPIQGSVDAATERDRLLALRSVRRDVWEIEAFLVVAEVGQTIAIDHPRLDGEIGRIISVSRSPTRGTMTLEIWV